MDIHDYQQKSRALFQSAQNLRSSSLDLDALEENLWDALCENLADICNVTNRTENKEPVEVSWVYSAHSCTGLVKSIGSNRSILGKITYVIRLCGTNAPPEEESVGKWPWLGQACVIMAWDRVRHLPWRIREFEPPNLVSIRHHGNGLWAWQYSADQNDCAYFFALPIFSLKNSADLKKYIIWPFKKLFYADIPLEVAAKALDKVPVLKPG